MTPIPRKGWAMKRQLSMLCAHRCGAVGRRPNAIRHFTAFAIPEWPPLAAIRPRGGATDQRWTPRNDFLAEGGSRAGAAGAHAGFNASVTANDARGDKRPGFLHSKPRGAALFTSPGMCRAGRWEPGWLVRQRHEHLSRESNVTSRCSFPVFSLPTDVMSSSRLESHSNTISRRGFACKHPGASRMRWTFEKPYQQRVRNDLFRYPDVSKTTKEPVDWMYGSPKSGYEGAKIHGMHTTIELTGLPMGKTPEYMQERLRRFFSKCGIIRSCRCIPHPLDPYQCEGRAYVSFRTKYASLQALRLVLRLPASLHSKVLRMRHLGNDKRNDWMYIPTARHDNRQLVSIARQLYWKICRTGAIPLSRLKKGVESFERARTGGAWRASGGHGAVQRRFGREWMSFLSFEPLNDVFQVMVSTRQDFNSNPDKSGREFNADAGRDNCDGFSRGDAEASTDAPQRSGDHQLNDAMVTVKLLDGHAFQNLMRRLEKRLEAKLDDELSVPWRRGRMELPKATREAVVALDHKPPLNEWLQILSRSKDVYKIHDERHLLKLRLKRERNLAKKSRKLRGDSS